MSRALTTDTANAFSADQVAPCILVEIDYPGGMVRVHSGIGDQEFNGETFTGVGTLGAVADIEETTDESSNGATFQLSASSAMLAKALIENPRNRSVKMWTGAYDLTSGDLIDSPALDFSGFVSHHSHTDDGINATITLIAVDETGDQERALEQRWTNEEQQRLYPGDIALEYVADMPNKEFTWGNAPVPTAIAPPSNGGGSDDITDTP